MKEAMGKTYRLSMKFVHKLRDADIRPILVEFCRRRGAKSTKGEKDIYRSRADFTAVFEKRWEGFEIKSEVDKLDRLKKQVHDYDDHFDRCWIVAHSRHFPKVVDLVPEHWGILEVFTVHDPKTHENTLVLELKRTPGPDHSVDRQRLLKMLWKSELADLLLSKGLKHHRSWAKHWLWKAANDSASLTTEEIRDYVRRCLCERYEEPK